VDIVEHRTNGSALGSHNVVVIVEILQFSERGSAYNFIYKVYKSYLNIYNHMHLFIFMFNLTSFSAILFDNPYSHFVTIILAS